MGKAIVTVLIAVAGYLCGVLWMVDVGAAIGCALALSVLGTMAWRAS